MALTDRQIERYSRQILASGFGGVAQERLLAARLAIVAGRDDSEPALSYMVGAGVGAIDLIAGANADAAAERTARMRDLNPDVALRHADRVPRDCDVLLALIGDADARSALDAVCADPRAGTAVIARLDVPARVALIPPRAGCPRCVGEALLEPPRARAEHAEFVAMVAAIEALKLLAGIAPIGAAGSMIEFNGLAASTRTLAPPASGPDAPACGCVRAPVGCAVSR